MSLIHQVVSPLDYLKVLPPNASSTPALVIDMDVLQQDFNSFRVGFPGTRIFYAVKANPHPSILRLLESMGAGFEISSLGELRLLQELEIPGTRIISSNPVKTPEFISEAHRHGITHFAFDSTEEVEKIAALAPGSKLSVRINVPNTGSDWPLDKKFGVDNDQALLLLRYARGRGLCLYGLTFHVGSQCRDIESWRSAMGIARQLWDQSVSEGMHLSVINVGGGMPIVYHRDDIPSIEAVGRHVLQAREELFPEADLWLEPGRAVIGRAGFMLSKVIGTAQRGPTKWVYLDCGVFNGLEEALGGIRYKFLTNVDGPETSCTVAGPSCDSMDVIAENVMLPPVAHGDSIVIPAAGAYTTVYASTFNGFPGPETIIVNGPNG